MTLEPGSALFFNMAFNDAWTHAIDPWVAIPETTGTGTKGTGTVGT